MRGPRGGTNCGKAASAYPSSSPGNLPAGRVMGAPITSMDATAAALDLAGAALETHSRWPGVAALRSRPRITGPDAANFKLRFEPDPELLAVARLRRDSKPVYFPDTSDQGRARHAPSMPRDWDWDCRGRRGRCSREIAALSSPTPLCKSRKYCRLREVTGGSEAHAVATENGDIGSGAIEGEVHSGI